MKQEILTVKTSKGGNWEFTANIVENLDEAKELYTPKGAFEIFMSGLKVKIMSIAREGFRKGKNRQEVEKDVAEWKPSKIQISVKALAAELLFENSELINSNPSLKKTVMKAFMKNDFKSVVRLLSD